MYYVLFCIIYLISLLPFWILYKISDIIYFLLYHVIRYRKKVVFAHIEQAFPEKTARQRIRIAKRFFRNLADLLVEMIKMMSINKRQIRKRFEYKDAVIKKLEKENRSCQVMLGHFFNWEWANLYMSLITNKPFLVTYKPLKDKTSNRLFRYMRSRFGSVLIASDNVQAEMKPFKDKSYTSVLVADQNPGGRRRVYWFPFLNKMTAFYRGPEFNAKRNHMAIVFGNIKKVKRGYYKIETRLAFEDARETQKGEIMEAFVKFMENCIIQQPDSWLWSHRRWKRKWKGKPNE